MIDLLEVIVSFTVGVIFMQIYHAFFKGDRFDQVFNDDAKKILNADEKPKNKSKGIKSKADVQKTKKDSRDIDLDKFLSRLDNADIEPEYILFLRNYLQQLNAQILEATESLNVAQQSKSALDTKIEEHKNARVTAEQKLSEIKAEMQNLKKKMKEMSAMEQLLAESSTTFEKKNVDLSANLSKALDDRSNLQAQVARLSEEASKLSARTVDMENALKIANEKLVDLESMKREQEDLILLNEKMSQESNAKLSQLEDAHNELKKVAEETNEMANNERSRADILAKEKEVLVTELDKKKTEEHLVRNALENSEKLVETLRHSADRIESIGKEREEVAAQLATAEQSVADLQNSLSLQSKEVDVMRKEKADLQEQVEKLKNDLTVGEEQFKKAIEQKECDAREIISTLKEENSRLTTESSKREVEEVIENLKKAIENREGLLRAALARADSVVNVDEANSLRENNMKLIESNKCLEAKNQELRARNMKVLGDFEKTYNQMTHLSNAAKNVDESNLKLKQLVVDRLAPLAQESLSDFSADNFSSWLSSTVSSATAFHASGDGDFSKPEKISTVKETVDVTTLITLEHLLLDIEKLVERERRHHNDTVLHYKKHLNQLQLSSLSAIKERVAKLSSESEGLMSVQSSLNDAISSLQ